MNHRRITAILLFLVASLSTSAVVEGEDLPALLARFESEHDIARKEAILSEVTAAGPDAAPALLKTARNTEDPDTKWMAIRGIGRLKFREAMPFLEQSLNSKSSYVRANSARALGEIGDRSAAPDLIHMLKEEQDSSVIEQTSLALSMLPAKKALSVLKARAHNPSAQTRGWILGAIAQLGPRTDVPFVANFLFDENQSVATIAGESIEQLTGQHIGVGHCPGNGICNPEPYINSAQRWWNDHKKDWK